MHAIVSMRWSMHCIWYLFLWIASFGFFESSAILIDLSCFTVITTGLMKYSSDHLTNFNNCLSSISFLVLFLLYLLDGLVLLFLYVVLGGMYGGMWILLYGFLIFQFHCRGVGVFGIPLLQCCAVPIGYFVFSHLVLCRLVRSRIFVGCLCLEG